MSDAGAEKYVEVTNYFKERMAESKRIASTRGREARIASNAVRMASGVKTWRQKSGVGLMIHEISHAGNKPFMIGFAIMGTAALLTQASFSDEAKAGSTYWQNYHADGKKSGH